MTTYWGTLNINIQNVVMKYKLYLFLENREKNMIWVNGFVYKCKEGFGDRMRGRCTPYAALPTSRSSGCGY